MISEHVKSLFNSVFHEDADFETNLSEDLNSYLEAIGDHRRQALLDDLQQLAGFTQSELSSYLDEVEFAWHLSGEESLFISDLVEFISMQPWSVPAS